MPLSSTSLAHRQQPLRILHLEDSEIDHALTLKALGRQALAFSIVRVDSLSDFVRLVQEDSFDVILADYRLPGFTALDAWEALSGHESPPPFILLSGAIGESAAVAAIHLGISDYLPKDDLRNLRRVIDRALAIFSAKAAEAKAAQELTASEERLAQFAEHLQTAIEKERAAIAREIHDDIGGSLAAVKLDLSWIARHESSPKVLEHLGSANEMLQHAIGSSQRIMMNLRPAILDQGLYPAIQWLTESFQRRTGIRAVLLTNNETLRASDPIQLTAYRTAQEALTNIAKYAECAAVKVELSDAEGVLTLEISDDGKGISEAQLTNAAAFGLRGLKERARVAGGWIDIITKPGSGTTIILSMPLDTTGTVNSEAHFQ